MIALTPRQSFNVLCVEQLHRIAQIGVARSVSFTVPRAPAPVIPIDRPVKRRYILNAGKSAHVRQKRLEQHRQLQLAWARAEES